MVEATEATQDRRARLRFAVVGPLLSAPPARGELAGELERLAGKVWRHPVSGEPVRFARSGDPSDGTTRRGPRRRIRSGCCAAACARTPARRGA